MLLLYVIATSLMGNPTHAEVVPTFHRHSEAEVKGFYCTGAVRFTLCLFPQASEKQVHFIVSRQTRQQTPDLLQETGWSYSAGSSQPCPAERNNPGKVRALVWFLCHPWDRGMGGQLVFHVSGCYLWLLSPEKACLTWPWKHKSCAAHYLSTGSALNLPGLGREREGNGQWWGWCAHRSDL